MWERPLYVIGAPLLTLIVTLFCTLKRRNYWLGPVVIFILLNIPTAVFPIVYPIGWSMMLGWAVFYTVIAVIIGVIIKLIKQNV